MSKKVTPARKVTPSAKAVTPTKTNPLIWVALGVLVLALVIVAVVSQKPATTAALPTTPAAGQAQPLPAEVNVDEALQRYNEGAFMLDVREPDEWVAGHIPVATLIPLGQLSNRLKELPKDREIVVVCRSGNRSAQARDILLAAGFTSVTSMGGGMNQWTAKGYPTQTGQ